MEGYIPEDEVGLEQSVPNPEQVKESATRKWSLWKWSAVGVLVVALAAGGVVLSEPTSKPAGVTPASVKSALEKFCSSGQIRERFGISSVRNMLGAWPMKDISAAYLIWCSSDVNHDPRSELKIDVLFFRTAFDENNVINQLPKSGTWTGSNFAPMRWSIGKGFVATYRYPYSDGAQSEGEVVNWMTKTFGAVPITQDFLTQHWTETLPPITSSSLK